MNRFKTALGRRKGKRKCIFYFCYCYFLIIFLSTPVAVYYEDRTCVMCEWVINLKNKVRGVVQPWTSHHIKDNLFKRRFVNGFAEILE